MKELNEYIKNNFFSGSRLAVGHDEDKELRHMFLCYLFPARSNQRELFLEYWRAKESTATRYFTHGYTTWEAAFLRLLILEDFKRWVNQGE